MAELKQKWNDWVGHPEEFSLKRRVHHLASLLSIVVIAIIVPVNFAQGLFEVGYAWSVAFVVVIVSFLLSRYRDQYVISFFLYVVAGYAAMAANYLWNAGLDGPTVLMIFLFFSLTIMMSPQRWTAYLLVIQIVVLALLMAVEFFYPHFVPETYLSREHRFLDVAFTVTVALALTYATLRLVITAYTRERRRVATLGSNLLSKNKELSELNAQKDRLISILSHDLRSPLTSIKGFLSIVNDPAARISDDERIQIEQQLLRMVDGTVDIVDNLLAWSKHAQQSRIEHLTAVNLSDLVCTVLATAQIMAHQKQIVINNECHEGHVALGDASLLTIVIRNLVGNAIKFTEPGGAIHIRSKHVPKGIEISVTDTGIGMNQSQLDALFQFKPGYSFGTGHERGTGMGLIVCKELVEKMDGELSVVSQVGKGSAFTLLLPLPEKLTPTEAST
jgi:signal transduction histidine kinase